jgi:LemA protein
LDIVTCTDTYKPGSQLAGCGYNRIQSQDEQAKAAWSEVLNQYQRRADLVPNLVSTVKGYADQEQRVLADYCARSRRARQGGGSRDSGSGGGFRGGGGSFGGGGASGRW